MKPMEHYFTQLSEMLWVGNANAAETFFSRGRKNPGNIRSIVCPAQDCIEKRGIVYHESLAVLTFPWMDDHQITQSEADACVAFYRAMRPTFVHCAAGANRSLAVAAILLVSDGLTLDQAFEKSWPWHDDIGSSVAQVAR